MTDTTYFTQCKNCEYCVRYYCEAHLIHIDNPEKDGCTFGSPKEVDNGQA